MADAHTPPSDAGPPPCANCGARSTGGFCSACGQQAGALQRHFGAFVHELLGSFFAFDGRVWRTLAPLFGRPGFLTRAWMEGRRAAYVPPLRLFLFFTILLFLVVNCQAGTTDLLVERESAEEPARVIVTEDGDDFELDLWLPEFWPFTALRRQMDAQEAKLRSMEPRVRDYVLSRRALELAPIGLLMVLPIMALFLRLWWLRTGTFWLDHLVFLLHGYAFLCGVTVLIVILPLPGWLWGLGLGLGVPAYFTLGMRRAYQRGWLRSGAGMLLGGFLTTFAMVIVALLLVPYALLTV